MEHLLFLVGSERLFKQMADLIVSDGYHDAGYTYVNVDDCWLDHQRDRFGRLQPDATRFPSGMKALADYIHGKGLKFGIYEDYGNFTCAGYPGILGHMDVDADTFASWDVDYVKLDGKTSLLFEGRVLFLPGFSFLQAVTPCLLTWIRVILNSGII